MNNLTKCRINLSALNSLIMTCEQMIFHYNKIDENFCRKDGIGDHYNKTIDNMRHALENLDIKPID